MSKKKIFQVKKNNEGFKITLSGDLSLTTVSEIKNNLNEYLDTKEPLQIEINNVDSIDIGIYQLLQSFIWSKKHNNHAVKVDISLPPEQQQLINTCEIYLRY